MLLKEKSQVKNDLCSKLSCLKKNTRDGQNTCTYVYTCMDHLCEHMWQTDKYDCLWKVNGWLENKDGKKLTFEISCFRLSLLETDTETKRSADGLLGRALRRCTCKGVKKAAWVEGDIDPWCRCSWASACPTVLWWAPELGWSFSIVPDEARKPGLCIPASASRWPGAALWEGRNLGGDSSQELMPFPPKFPKAAMVSWALKRGSRRNTLESIPKWLNIIIWVGRARS